METIARKKNEPICKEALDYVRQHVYIAFSNEEFCIIEEYVVEKLHSLYPDGHLGDGDLRKYVCEKLTETNVLIPQSKVDIIIINIMYDIMLATDTLSLIATSFTLKTWYNWDSIMTDAIRVFTPSL
ncbi:hypothetical protein AGMMS49574_01550 [Bacteroidia bacterium]|nr:hypothetical protein AGMMS49574_01550 [Bacteroidia bacterium]